MTPIPPSRRAALAGLLLAALVGGCAQPLEHPVIWDAKTTPPTIEPLEIDGRCALLVSGSASGADLAISHVGLVIERGMARIEVDLAPPDQWTSPRFHVVVPVEEQHVAVVYVGATQYPVWERGAGAKACSR